MHYSLGWSKDPGPSADGEVPHYGGVYTRHFFTEFEVRRRYMKELSIFIDESGDFGEYDYIVDAIFGIGLSRKIEGRYAQIIPVSYTHLTLPTKA